ncbi:hypothetical protein [Fischerella sp. JS2]|uniref:hypothetical protein n=1 Tax=Fischerella sp. JS2 TaxID=2597771 RepID=UPI0028E5DF48|nr:hypothetical protein [Fischerella sp. JS2]
MNFEFLLVYSEELCEQVVTEFQKAWDSLGDRTLSTYRFWGSHELDNANKLSKKL